MEGIYHKKLFVPLLFPLYTNYSYCQNNNNLLYNTQLIGGVYLHEIVPLIGISAQGGRSAYASTEFGIQHRFNNSPISINYRRVWNYISETNNNILFEGSQIGNDYDEIDQFFLNYHLEKKMTNYRFGLGYFHKRWLTPGYFRNRTGSFLSIFEYRGIAISTAFDLDNMSIEFKKYMDLTNISLFEAHLYAISLNKYFSLKKENTEKKEGTEKSTFLDNFSLYISMRLQAIKYYHTQNEDLYNFFSFAPGIGISYFDPKHQLEFVLSRDSWKRYIGGTYNNDLIGYISTSGIAVKKHLTLNNDEQKLIFGIGWYPIRNDNEPQRVKTKTIIADFPPGQEFEKKDRKSVV